MGFAIRGYLLSEANPTNNDGNTSITRRSANINDVTVVNEDFDWSNIGAKIVFNPKVDIDGFELTFQFYDSGKKCLKTIVKKLGNVKKGVQISCSISIVEIIDILFTVDSATYTVSGGTVSIFAI